MPVDRSLVSCRLGATVLVGAECHKKTCANGLPLVPTSIRMLGRFQRLRHLVHRNLCNYVELARCATAANAVILVSEHYTSTLGDVMPRLTLAQKKNVAFQIAQAIEFVHSEDLAHGDLSMENVCVLEKGDEFIVRLTGHGPSVVSDHGMDLLAGVVAVNFHSSPEISIGGSRCSTASDVWSLGIILLQLFTGIYLKDVWSKHQFFSILKNGCARGVESSMLQFLLSALETASRSTYLLPEMFSKMIDRCLTLLPSQRGSIEDVLSMMRNNEFVTPVSTPRKLKTIEEMEADILRMGADWKLEEFDLSEMYFLWKLCGSSVESILGKAGIIKLQAPVTTLPYVVVEDYRLFGNDDGRSFRVSPKIFVLPDENLRKKLLSLDDASLLYSCEVDGDPKSDDYSQLSVIVKEKDLTYQASRMAVVRHVLHARFLKPALVHKFIDPDVPPMLRPDVWSVLLDVTHSDLVDFIDYDTVAPHSSDRQLDVDIPRCHQYDELMTSPAAHAKLRRLLKAWLLSHPQYVYWQGCDSLSAPFLLLYFNDLPTGLACLTRFIDKYLHNFFLKDNSMIIQEYLAVFNHLLAYVDSQLYTHLAEMDFIPELFAIPWFLTCFAHVLPLHKLFHVWDQLLLRDASYPLFIGLAVLRQLRPRLINATFNDAILLFSDLPDLSMERVLSDSLAFYERVPPSCAYRSQANPNNMPASEEPRSLRCSLTPMSHQELKAFGFARMSPQELEWRVHRQLVAAIDVRPYVDFARASVIRSLNYPNPNDTSLLNILAALTVAQRNQHPICIISGMDVEVAKKFAASLVQRSVDGVCLLDGGFESVRKVRDLIHVAN